jgi:hypothetical protein
MFPIKKPYTISYRHGQKTFYNAAHIGIDIMVPEETPVHAPGNGIVKNIFFGAQGGNWLSVEINGRTHRFAHLKAYKVQKGQSFKDGAILALTGGKKGAPYSGNSTNPHLHWDINDKGKYIDPLSISWDTKPSKPMPTLEEQLAKEKADHAESIRQKESNYQAWQTQLDRANGLEIEKKDYYDKWQIEIEARHKIEEQLKVCRESGSLTDEQRRNLALLEQIRALLYIE